jgi:hypothetical protein
MDGVLVGGVKIVKDFRVNIGKIEVVDAGSEVVIVLFFLSGHVDDFFSLFLFLFASRASVVVRLILFEVSQ